MFNLSKTFAAIDSAISMAFRRRQSNVIDQKSLNASAADRFYIGRWKSSSILKCLRSCKLSREFCESSFLRIFILEKAALLNELG